MSKTLYLATAAMALAAMPGTAQAAKGDTFVRVRAIMVSPTEKSGPILPAFPADGVKVNDAFTPEVDITHMITNNLGVELIAATTKHTASGKTGTPAAVGKLASTWVLPPTVTLQYHFAPEAKIRPYLGVGANLTLFYSEKPSKALETALGQSKVKMKTSAGWAAQAGVDIDLNEKMFLNLDVKYIDIDTTAKIRTTAAGLQTVKISLDPIVVGVGVGFRF
jgi:outer membrane protein